MDYTSPLQICNESYEKSVFKFEKNLTEGLYQLSVGVYLIP